MTSEKKSTHKGCFPNVSDEILSHVCSYLPTEALKVAKITCRRLRPHCEKYLFETIVVWKTTDDWERLHNILSTPHLASQVAHIKLARTENLSQLLDYFQYGTVREGRLGRKSPPLMLMAG